MNQEPFEKIAEVGGLKIEATDNVACTAVEEAAAQLGLQKAWDVVVRNIIAKSKKIKPEDVAMPEGETGHYSRLALNNRGELATGRKRGRKHPHWRPVMNALKSLTLDLFKHSYAESLRVEMLDAAKEGRPLPESLGEQESMQLYVQSMMDAQKQVWSKARKGRHAARDRQRFSRRVNFGIVDATASVISVAAALPKWADIRRITQRKYNVAPKPKPVPAAAVPSVEAPEQPANS